MCSPFLALFTGRVSDICFFWFWTNVESMEHLVLLTSILFSFWFSPLSLTGQKVLVGLGMDSKKLDDSASVCMCVQEEEGLGEACHPGVHLCSPSCHLRPSVAFVLNIFHSKEKYYVWDKTPHNLVQPFGAVIALNSIYSFLGSFHCVEEDSKTLHCPVCQDKAVKNQEQCLKPCLHHPFPQKLPLLHEAPHGDWSYCDPDEIYHKGSSFCGSRKYGPKCIVDLHIFL